MELKSIEKAGIKEVVEVHKNSFKGFFLTTLGDGFLHLYYDSIRKDRNAILIGIYNEEKLCGFCAATFKSKGFNSQLIKNNMLQFSIVGLHILFSKPKSFVHLIKNFQKKSPSLNDKGEYSELLSIGVYENFQGQGIGKKLLQELEKVLSIHNCSILSLTTDFYNNDGVIEFYKRLGYETYYDFIAYPERKMYRMIKTINRKI